MGQSPFVPILTSPARRKAEQEAIYQLLRLLSQEIDEEKRDALNAAASLGSIEIKELPR